MLANERLGFRESREIEILPSEVTPYNVEFPPGRVRIEGPFGAEVFVAGELVGLLPLEPAEVPVGIQEIVVRHDSREWQETVDVTLREPEVVTIDTSIGGRARR